MSLEMMRELMRRFTPGRRVKLQDGREGLVLQIVPAPTYSLRENDPAPLIFNLAVEIIGSDGRPDVAIIDPSIAELVPFDRQQVLAGLWHRTVEFPPHTVSMFPKGASDKGLICDVQFHADAEPDEPSMTMTVIVTVEDNPDCNTHYATVDCTQCVLRLRFPAR